MSQCGSLTKTSVHALPSGMAVAAVTPTALTRKMNVSGHVADIVSPDCTADHLNPECLCGPRESEYTHVLTDVRLNV